MERRGLAKSLLNVIGGFGIVLASFFITLAVMDHWTTDPAEGERIIKIEEATYGANCGKNVKTGNATVAVAKSCDGRLSCNYLVSVEELGDPAQGCGKDFSVRFTCSQQQPVRTSYVKGEANRSTVRVNCEKR